MRRPPTSFDLFAGPIVLAIASAGCATTPSAVAAPEVVEIASNGAWTWFNDERAVRLDDGSLLVGYVRDDGVIAVTNYDPGSGERHEMELSSPQAVEVDDHNNPSLTLLPDGRVLAVYSRHHTDEHYFWRVSRNPDPRAAEDWSPEGVKEVGARNTYANTFRLSAENDRIFNFHRAINFNPTLTLSDDLGESWGEPIHFITAGTGRQRPYPRYASNGIDRIDLIYTDAHPRDLNNSIYHLFYQGGAFHRSNGEVLRRLDELPIAHDQGERGTVIYRYSDERWGAGDGPDDWIPGGRGWTWDVAYDDQGRPVVAFQVRVGEVTGDGWEDARIFYYYARWNGAEWEKHFIAQAGRPLYDREQDYAGGMAIDPRDPNVVYVSSNALRPFDLDDLADVPLQPKDRYILYRGETADGGRTFQWSRVDPSSTGNDLRPHVVAGNGRPTALVWFRGDYDSYTEFDSRVMGLVAGD